MILEDAQATDLPSIAALNVAAYREFAQHLAPEAWAMMKSNLSKTDKVAERATFIVARINGVLAASVAYCPAGRSVDPIPTEWASVLLLAVSPEFRGQSLGEQLTRECIRRALADGAETIGLFTSELMVPAQRIYEKLGFVKESEIPPRHGKRYFRYRLDLKK
ncbi:MAG TPA: hypothetical protein DCQ83_09575 [Fibrobacteres bacterium]|nr:hypothetical protein [Fibrobacterota bacterium]